MNARDLSAAYLLDLTVGDPQYVPHPTRLMGYAIARGERFARRNVPETPRAELLAGGVLAFVLIATTYAATALLIARLRRIDRRLGTIVDIILAKSTLATRDLCDEVVSIVAALETSDIALARTRLARVVGRDTIDLDKHEIARAAIETLAESLCDGVVSPLCALALGGTPAAMAFKAVSTLDSTIGHIKEPYTFFGRVCARLDDVANFVPARLTALLIAGAAVVTGKSGKEALRVWLRDGRLHRSPNSGQSEASMAGALGVRLGGPNRYGGALHDGAFLGHEYRLASSADIRCALRITVVASAFSAVLAVLLRKTLHA